MLKQFIITTFLLGAFAAATPAQSAAEQAARSARDQFSDIKNRSIEIERMKREASKPTFKENFTLNFPKIKEDFEQIQKINDDLVKLIAAQAPLDDSTVAKFASEINRRAARLRSNLFKTDAEQKKEAKNKQTGAAETRDIKKLLGALDKSIDRFVHNSIFVNINLVDAADSIEAQKDLETVISLSAAVKAKVKN